MIVQTLQHKFVDFIPEVLEDGILYVSIEYATAMHNCACGCGNRVVTPFSPYDWKLTFDGETISLFPSIGNWNFECKSHYWIEKSKIKYAKSWLEMENEISEGTKRKKKNRFGWLRKGRKKN